MHTSPNKTWGSSGKASHKALNPHQVSGRGSKPPAKPFLGETPTWGPQNTVPVAEGQTTQALPTWAPARHRLHPEHLLAKIFSPSVRHRKLLRRVLILYFIWKNTNLQTHMFTVYKSANGLTNPHPEDTSDSSFYFPGGLVRGPLLGERQ